MIENSATKDMAGDKPETVEQEPVVSESLFHFPGGGEYFPMAVKASSPEKAHEIYLKKRVPYNP